MMPGSTKVTVMQETDALTSAASTDPAITLDRKAVEALITRQYTGLRLLILRRVGNAELAADLLNDAIGIALEKWQSGLVRRPDQIGGYVFKVAMNLLRNHRRSIAERPDRRASAQVLESLPDGTDPTDVWLEKKIALRVKSILKEMGSARDREILIRFHLNEEDKASICRDLGLDGDQFDKVLHRARTRLKALLESHGLKRTDFFMFCLL